MSRASSDCQCRPDSCAGGSAIAHRAGAARTGPTEPGTAAGNRRVAALANSSDRFTSLQQLISAIGSATDEKASLDLTARITAEQAMEQNEQTKLQVLYQVAQAQEWSRAQQVRERAIADQGSLRSLPPMGL